MKRLDVSSSIVVVGNYPTLECFNVDPAAHEADPGEKPVRLEANSVKHVMSVPMDPPGAIERNHFSTCCRVGLADGPAETVAALSPPSSLHVVSMKSFPASVASGTPPPILGSFSIPGRSGSPEVSSFTVIDASARRESPLVAMGFLAMTSGYIPMARLVLFDALSGKRVADMMPCFSCWGLLHPVSAWDSLFGLRWHHSIMAEVSLGQSTPRSVGDFVGHKLPIRAVASDAEDGVLFSAATDCSVKVWSRKSREAVATFVTKEQSHGVSLANVSEKSLLVVGKNGEFEMWDRRMTRKSLRSVRVHCGEGHERDPLALVQVAPTHFASVCYGGEVALWSFLEQDEDEPPVRVRLPGKGQDLVFIGERDWTLSSLAHDDGRRIPFVASKCRVEVVLKKTGTILALKAFL